MKARGQRASSRCDVRKVAAGFLLLAASCAACGDDQGLDFGNTALLHPLSGLDHAAERDFFIGKSFFHSNWVAYPSTTSARAGLGPYFNARACGGCHAGNGRGVLPPGERIEAVGNLVIKLSLPGARNGQAPQPEPTYGGELSPFALPGLRPEAKVRVRFEEVSGAYGDGEKYTLHRPRIEVDDLSDGPLAPGTIVAARIAPAIAGAGLLEAIDAAAIRAQSDRQQRQRGPIKGRINAQVDARSQREVVTRFGWKAAVASVAAQTADAFFTDIGITSLAHPQRNCSAAQRACLAMPASGALAIDAATLARVVHYVELLAPPPQAPRTAAARRGEQRFGAIGCAACHGNPYRTAAHPRDNDAVGIPPEYLGQPVLAYTDLLLHDMGDDLADGREEYRANGRQWRTAPLWGIGLAARTSGGESYLHDGRARSLAEAILWHAGEADAARQAFVSLPAPQRAELLEFLHSL